jgi:hypothetical protein
VERGVGRRNRLEERRDLAERRRPDLKGHVAWWGRIGRRVQPYPLPAQRLRKGAVQHNVNAPHSRRREGLPVPPTATQKVRVEVDDVGGGQLSDVRVA